MQPAHIVQLFYASNLNVMCSVHFMWTQFIWCIWFGFLLICYILNNLL